MGLESKLRILSVFCIFCSTVFNPTSRPPSAVQFGFVETFLNLIVILPQLAPTEDFCLTAFIIIADFWLNYLGLYSHAQACLRLPEFYLFVEV